MTALQNEDTWKARRRPHPLFLEKVLTEDDVVTTNSVCSSEGTISASASLGFEEPSRNVACEGQCESFFGISTTFS